MASSVAPTISIPIEPPHPAIPCSESRTMFITYSDAPSWPPMPYAPTPNTSGPIEKTPVVDTPPTAPVTNDALTDASSHPPRSAVIFIPLPPPSYLDAIEESKADPVPVYERVDRTPPTLARHLFKYGFLFPLFWAVAITILFCDLNPIPQPECGKTTEQQAEELEYMRTEELKWAWRSVYALCLLLLALVVATGLLYFIVLHK